MRNNKLSRRALLQSAACIAPVAMTGCASLTRDTAQNQAPMVQASDPVARALAYYPATGEVPADNPLAVTHNVSQTCSNCLHNRGSAGPGRLTCPTFPGRTVSVDGWCSLWAPA